MSGEQKPSGSPLSPGSTLSLRTPDQVQQDLFYLQEHNVCETLEFIVKGLLRDQPEDPILAICNMLRTSNRSNTSVRNSANSGGPSLFSIRSEEADACPRLRSPLGTPVTAESTGKSFSVVAPNKADATTAANTRANASASSRADTPASTVPQTRWPDQPTGNNKLERDESSRSDGSVFSISSIDMSEFLSEFRAAHLGLFGDQNHPFINMQDLADIVDRIAIPLPDVKLLVDLFNELKEFTGDEGVVAFDAFLARMNFKIQGRYPIEVIRTAFFKLLPPDVTALARPVSAAVGRGLPASGSVGSNLDAFLMGSSGVEMTRDSAADMQAVSQLLQSTPSVATSAESISQVALWHGLGLRCELATVEGLLLPHKKGSDYTLFFTDFVKVVQTLCGKA